MIVIGLTGGIGSGKSTVARFLAKMGAGVIDADIIGHEILEADEEIRRELAGVFGDGVLTKDGRIDRKALAGIVFRQPEALERLNRITHPRITKEVKKRLADYRKKGAGVVIIEAPLLIEAGWASRVDRVWVTRAPGDVIIKRLEGKGMRREEAEARIRAQATDNERLRHADEVIDTDCSLMELELKTRGLWAELKVE